MYMYRDTAYVYTCICSTNKAKFAKAEIAQARFAGGKFAKT